MIVVGIDAGSRAIKIVLLETAGMKTVAAGRCDQGIRQDQLAGELLHRLLAGAGLARKDVAYCVATGYARNLVSAADTTITEITCHARGVHHLRPAARTIIDIGGQDSKVIRLEDGGSVRDFAMNDRCAAGTGRFLELVADRLAVGLDKLGELAGASAKPAVISSMCAVFAETEIIGLLAGGASPADIAAGVQNAVAARILAMAGAAQPPVIFTGGVALVAGMSAALEESLACPVAIAPDPQMTGALGAALLAGQRVRSAK